MTLGLIRQYLSKGTDFNKLTDRQVLRAASSNSGQDGHLLGKPP